MILMASWHVSGVWKPLPRRAVPLALVAVLPSFFLQLITETLVLGVFLLEMWERMILCGCFWHAMEYINDNNNALTH